MNPTTNARRALSHPLPCRLRHLGQRILTGVAALMVALAPAAAGRTASASPASPPPDAGVAAEAVAEQIALPDTTPGHCARDFFAAANDGTATAAERFEERWASAARQGARPKEQRIAGLAGLFATWHGIEARSVVASNSASIIVAVTTGAGEPLEIELRLDSAEPDRLQAIMIASFGDRVAPQPISAAERRQLIEDALAALRAGYVYPEVAEQMSTAVLAKLEQGDYDEIADDALLAQRLTADLRAVSHDKHLGVRVAPRQDGAELPESGPSRADMRRQNFAFRTAEILPDNIGYLKFNAFVDDDEAKATAAAALAFLAHCDALIVDLRENGGGSPEMIRFISSYLFDTPTHLNSMVDRSGRVIDEFWTLADVPGQRFPTDLPVYVLVSSYTFSGAEEFAYNLKNLKRAVIVGETTGGGAHPVRGERISDRIVVRVPFMRAMNPISGTNWEGVGVEPDVPTAAGVALERAQALAREAIRQ
ncbi:MAG: S41 family peptidase [Phycisphaerales bacterium]|nr:S41 family peptidase [Phycisphaerales bacterium]